MTHDYTLTIFQLRRPTEAGGLDHVELGSYRNLGSYEHLEVAPWVPPVGSYFRFRDFQPPGKQVDHAEKKGRVKEVVTCFYGTRSIIEVYIEDDNG